MPSQPLLLLILLLAALAAMLAGLGAFGTNRPPDPRVATLLQDLEDVKQALLQLQKALGQTEKRLEKEVQASRQEGREVLEKLAEGLDRRLRDLAD
jgi:hypothetical protein